MVAHCLVVFVVVFPVFSVLFPTDVGVGLRQTEVKRKAYRFEVVRIFSDINLRHAECGVHRGGHAEFIRATIRNRRQTQGHIILSTHIILIALIVINGC